MDSLRTQLLHQNQIITDSTQTMRRLTISYFVVFCTIATLIIINVIFSQLLISTQTDHTHLINVAGRQRMLNQQISKDVLALLNEEFIEDTDVYLDELAEDFILWGSVHEEMHMGGGDANLPHPSKELTMLLDAIEPYHHATSEATECILQLYEKIATDLACNAELEEYASIILSHEQDYISAMEIVISQLEKDVTSHLQIFRSSELILTIVALLILVLEAIFIFRFTIDKMQQSFTGLLNIHTDLNKANDTLKQEIIERKQIQQTLVAERNLLQTFIDSVPDYIVVKDSREHFLLSNVAHSKSIGLEPEDFVGKTAFDIYPPDLATLFHDDDERVLKYGESLISEERHILDNDGGHKWVLTTKKPVYGDDGKIWGLVSISRDITQRKNSELALKAAFEKEKELNEQKDRFMAMASHEFRTPLAVIQSSSQILERYFDTISSKKRDHHLQKISQQIKYLDEMIENIMVITRQSNNPLQIRCGKLDCVSLCSEIIENLSNSIGANHHLTLSHQENFEHISADVDMLRIMISNLVSNAIKYSPIGTEIRLDLKQDKSKCVFQVIDQGIGITPEQIEHIFEAYYRADSSGEIKGIGLGLKIVKDFVELHDGTIHVESVVGEGTSFTITIPIEPSTTTIQ